MTLFRPRISALCVLLAAVACKPNESGNIPCQDDSNCPTDYPQCIRVGPQAGKCTESAVGVPQLGSNAIGVAPGAISGGTRPTIALALPAVAGNLNLARKATLAISVAGGAAEAVVKSDGTPVTLDDAGKTISVLAPSTIATDSKTYTYTLTISNDPGSTGAVTANGTLTIAPRPTLAGGTISISDAVITGGTTAQLSAALPGLFSAPESAASVSLAVSNCGTGNVTKVGGAGLAAGDLGHSVSIPSPSTNATDSKSCNYTLTVANAAGDPEGRTTATGTLGVVPAPQLDSSSFTPATAAITAGTTPVISIPLPSATAATGVTFTVDTGSGASPQQTTGNQLVALTDLGHSIDVQAPSVTTAVPAVITYVVTISNSATTPAHARASGTVAVIPVPSLAAGSFSITPGTITGNSSQDLTATLPALTSDVSSASSAEFAVSGTGCPSVNVPKTGAGAGPVGVGDLNASITFASPSTSSALNGSCTYTLTVANSVGDAAGKTTATGTLNVVPVPTLSPLTFTISPGVVTGGTSPSLGATLPQLTSPASAGNTAKFTVSSNCGGGDVPKTSTPTGLVGIGDLNGTTSINFDPPNSTFSKSTDLKTCTYTLKVTNGAVTPASVTATGTISIVPVPQLSSNTFTIIGGPVTGGVTPRSLAATMPGLTSLASVTNSATLAVSSNCGGVNISKTNNGGGLVGIGDLGLVVDFLSPSGTQSTDSMTCTYTFKVSNGAPISPGSASATGTITVIPLPMFASSLSVTPNVILGGTTTPGLLQFMLPALSLGSASSLSMTVSPPPNTPVVNAGLVPANLGSGSAVAIDPPSTQATDPTTAYTYSLKAIDAAADPSAPTTATVTSFPPSTDLTSARVGATATLLPDGTVLIAGGGTGISKGICTGATSSAQIYNPSTGAVSSAGNMTQNRCQHTAVLSADQTKVFVMGGTTSLDIDVYVVGTGWQASPGLPTLQQPRTAHSATLLGSASVSSGNPPTVDNRNKIVVVGGYDPTNSNAGRTDLELFDPTASGGNGSSILYQHKSGGSQVTTVLSAARADHAAVLVGASLFIIGGVTGASGTPTYSATIDILDTTRFPNSGLTTSQITTSNPSGTVARAGHSAIMVDSSTILVAGGYNGTNVLKSMQTYTVDSASVPGSVTSASTAQNLANVRVHFPLLWTGLTNKYLVFGGSSAVASGGDTASGSIELIDLGAGSWASSFGTLRAQRQAAAAVNLGVSGASNLVFLVAGGGASGTGGVELVIGP